MNQCKHIHILVAVVAGIVDAELEIGHVDTPRPELSDDEPAEQEEIEYGIGERRAV